MNLFQQWNNKDKENPKFFAKKNQKIMNLLKKYNSTENEIFMIAGILEMHQSVARDIMIPRVNVMTMDINATKKEFKELIKKNFYSRIPLYENSIDNVSHILRVKEVLIYLMESSNSKKIPIKKFITEAYLVPESKKVTDILRELQEKHMQMAIVIDEYGGFSGIITVEDIIEEIVGDISNEEQEDIREISNNVYSVNAQLTLEEINKHFNLTIKDKNADTIGGYAINLFGQIPKINQKVTKENITLKILNKRKNSITRIKLTINEESNVS